MSQMEMSRTFKQIRAYARQRSLPVIPIRANDVSMLECPETFYKVILEKIHGAESRIALSTLYIGTGQKERALAQAIRHNLSRNPDLDVSITLDVNRANRSDQQDGSSSDLVKDLSITNNSVKFNFMQASQPSSLIQRFLSHFQRWNELSSTYHSKLLVFDNDVIMTGANLSSIYFEKRQDRYMTIEGSKCLSDYIVGFLDDLRKTRGQLLATTIQNFNEKYISDLNEETTSDCYIIPLVQCAPQGLRTCDDFLMFLQDILPSQAKVHLSSGYFNPKIDMRLSSFIAPSEEANGFYRGGGMLRFVPHLYSALMKQYLDRNRSCEMYLYKRPGWSYHGKGLWIEGLGDLNIHMIGSSNFNWRSSERDFESQFVIITTNAKLNYALGRERKKLLAESTLVSPTSKSLNLNPIYTLAANLLKSLL